MKLIRIILLLSSLLSIDAFSDIASDIRAQDINRINEVSQQIFKINSNHFIQRPWGGALLESFKRINHGTSLGESVEFCAFDGTQETQNLLSTINFSDNSTMTMVELLSYAGDAILGSQFIAKYGKQIPLLLKFINSAHLPSCKTHSVDDNATYVIVKADPSATIRMGMKKNADISYIKRTLRRAQAMQQTLLKMLRFDSNQTNMFELINDHFSNRKSSIDLLSLMLTDYLHRPHHIRILRKVLTDLKTTYWIMLDLLNEIEVTPGMIIHNPAHINILGNEKHYEMLALAVTHPKFQSFRLWDNVRFPIRSLQVDQACASFGFTASNPEDFIKSSIVLTKGQEQLFVNHQYSIERLTIDSANPMLQNVESNPHIIVAIKGSVLMYNSAGAVIGSLKAGETALIPAALKNYECKTVDKEAILIKVTLPL